MFINKKFSASATEPLSGKRHSISRWNLVDFLYVPFVQWYCKIVKCRKNHVILNISNRIESADQILTIFYEYVCRVRKYHVFCLFCGPVLYHKCLRSVL